MSKYFMDCEFLEGTQDKTILGIKYGKTKPTIDLISIGVCSSDNREYYAISKDFNLKEAWNRYEWYSVNYNKPSKRKEEEDFRVYWIRENVLKSIFDEWNKYSYHTFNYKNMKYCIDMIGKTNKQIAEEVKEFVSYSYSDIQVQAGDANIKFYGYYCDYDWVAFCWLFGKMIDLPNGFSMYCRDLKQILDEKEMARQDGTDMVELRNLPTYPTQTNEHNALADAKWNKQLHEFLNQL